MGEFLSYSIVSGLLMLALYLAYRLLLARDNQHGFNRAVLMLIYIVSFSFPAFYSLISNWNTGTAMRSMSFETLEIVGTTEIQATKPIWGTILIWIYIAGMVIVSVKTIVTWIRLTAVIRRGDKIRQNGYTLVITENERFAPFSWMHYIVISRSDYENSCDAITVHEMKHVAARHWIDLLIAQIVCVINWFNPAAWLMRDELMLIHEYQADMAVIDSGHNPQEYQMLLIRKAVGARFPSLANSLNHSKLKKRITMMYKEKSGAGRKLKALALVPVLAMALGASTIPAVRAAVSAISSSEISVSKGSENTPKNKTVASRFRVTDINNSGTETSIVIKGEGLGNNLTVSGGSLTNNGKTYQAKSLNCNMTDGVATITATFPVSEGNNGQSMTLDINGDEVSFDIENATSVPQTDSKGDTSSPAKSSFNTITINGSSSVLDGMSIIIDGKEVDKSELDKLSPEKIASITVNKQGNQMLITTTQPYHNVKITY